MKSILIGLVALVILCSAGPPLNDLSSCQVSLFQNLYELKGNMNADGLV